MERTLSKYAILSVNARNRHTQLKALNVLVNNTLKLSSLTGDASDTEAVQGVGGDSGARIQALACSGIGVEGPGAAGFTAQYLHWGYEHLFYRITFGGNGLIVAGQLVSNLTTTSARMSGTLLSGMKVSRGLRWWRNLDGWQTWQLTFDRQSVKSG
jgi:hypothetical protein